ncbi:MAG: hypothetical protein QY314_04435 [Candidatus Dojkabacteria bacterium]|nr:MAG: hypothetical protein QY314_04435 [Candidatus Dojkabacteria bacterium]
MLLSRWAEVKTPKILTIYAFLSLLSQLVIIDYGIMKLNSTVILAAITSPAGRYAGILLVWILIALFMFTPFSYFIVERILETSSATIAKEGTSYVLSPVSLRVSANAVNATELQNKVFQNNTVEITSQSSLTDARIVAMRRFLLEQNSPLMPYSELIVTEADRYGLDWRIVVAISGVESRFCRIYPAGTFNGWGWKGGPGGAWQEFGSWDNAIRHMTQRLALGYNRLNDPYIIEPVYCPPCAASGHNWARAVSAFMWQLDQQLEKSKLPQ